MTEQTMQRLRNVAASVCKCGHTGDGPGSQHAAEDVQGLAVEGHGRCTVDGCDCSRFTWVDWSETGRTILAGDPGRVMFMND